MEKSQGLKRLISLPHDDKIPEKSPRPRRNIALSRSQSDVFAQKPLRKINVQDPFYTPSKGALRKVNPFNAREDLKGGKIKFFDLPSKSVISHVFDLHSPKMAEMGSSGSVRRLYSQDTVDFAYVPRRRCRSLPVSPELVKRDVPAASSALGWGDPAQATGGEARLKLCNIKYGVSDIPPYNAHSSEGGPTHDEAMDCLDGICPSITDQENCNRLQVSNRNPTHNPQCCLHEDYNSQGASPGSEAMEIEDALNDNHHRSLSYSPPATFGGMSLLPEDSDSDSRDRLCDSVSSCRIIQGVVKM